MKTKLFILLMFFAVICAAQNGSNDIFIQEVAKVFTEKDGIPGKKIKRISLSDKGEIVANSCEQQYVYKNGKWILGGKLGESCKEEKNDFLSKTSLEGKIYYGKKDGLFVKSKNSDKLDEIFPNDEKYNWKLSNVKVLIVDNKNRLWFGANEGIGFLEKNEWKLFTGKEGLPFKHFTSISKGINDQVWFGTKKGAIRTDGKSFAYRFSRRWLPDDYINDIKLKDSTIWIATNKGISKIDFVPMSFENKAEYFTNQVESRHTRIGFVVQNHLKERYNPETWAPAISDNDGMYTAMYGAAQAFRYAVTKDPEAKELAKRSFEACKWLVDITHEKGFPARVIIPIDWHEPVNEQYNEDYNLRKQEEDPFWKNILPRFVKSKDGKYLWKCDTSSDELAGHYFFYSVYYDLVTETEEEKSAVREVVADVTDHLVRNGFLLRDHDGKPTRWGNFSPEFFNSIWGWDQRGLNSMMMLSFLNVAEHVTEDAKYAKTAKLLRDKHHYHINAMQSKMFFPPEDVVPWDNNLCLMSMYGLLKYEKDNELIMMYRESLENSWLHISKQKNAFWNMLYASQAIKFNKLVDEGIYNSGKYFKEAGPYSEFTANQYYKKDFKVEDIVETLQKIPLDLIGYRMDNRHRLDIVFDPTPGQVVNEGWRPVNPIRTDNTFELSSEHKMKVGWHVDGKALPIDERAHVRLDRDGFAIDATEGSGYSEHEGTFYLLPYYMARYYKQIN